MSPHRSTTFPPMFHQHFMMAAYGFVFVLLGTSTIWRGGNRAIPLLWLELLALFILVLIFVRTIFNDRPLVKDNCRAFALLIIFCSPAFILVVQTNGFNGTTPHSRIPDSTYLSILASLPLLAVFLSALSLPAKLLSRLLILCMTIGSLQAALGLFQLAFPDLLFDPSYKAPVLGTFGNRNGLGNYLAMMLPLLWFWVSGNNDFDKRSARGKVSQWMAGAALFLTVGCLVASLSRAALATGLLGLALSVALLPQRNIAGSRQFWMRTIRWWPLGLVIISMALGSWEWMSRFEPDNLIGDEALRSLIREKTWLAVKDYWPLGSGMGTFAAVFPAYQPVELSRYFVNFAHNDYFELFFEGGALIIPALLSTIWLISTRALQLGRLGMRDWGNDDKIAVVCGVSVLAQALHAWVDYPWQVPANALLGAFLLGMFIRRPSDRHTV